MKIRDHLFLCLCLLQVSAGALAQADTGGGMGGTGIREKPAAVAPAKSEEPCSKDKSIGIYQLNSGKDKKIKTRGYVCDGQILQTGDGEEIELQLRYGEKIVIQPNSKVQVSRPN